MCEGVQFARKFRRESFSSQNQHHRNDQANDQLVLHMKTSVPVSPSFSMRQDYYLRIIEDKSHNTLAKGHHVFVQALEWH